MIKKIIEKIRFLTNRQKEPYFLYYKLLGFYPKDYSLYNLALSHKSSRYRGDDGKYANNERLEYLGDAILEAIVSDFLYFKYKGQREGYLTSVRSKIVKRETLNKVADSMGLASYITLPNKLSSHNFNVYGNALEALIGAIYLDQGYEKCKLFVEKEILKKHLNINKIADREENFKSRLIEWGQKHKVPVLFDLIEETMDEKNNPMFRTQIMVNGCLAGHGVGYTKKESQQNAAKVAVKAISVSPERFKQTDNQLSKEQIQEADVPV